MFFILSKLLVFFLQPLNWIMALLLFALFSKKPKRKRVSLIIAVALLWFFTNHFIFNQIVRWWEPETILMNQITTPYDIGILLGGYSNFLIEPASDRYNFAERANRFTQALELYKSGKVKKLLITGGSGSLLADAASEALAIHPFLIKIGIPDSVIILEPDSRNTYENALFTKATLDEKYPVSKCLLITSAWHMPRSLATFKKAVVNCTPFCVDYMSERTQFLPSSLLIPNRNVLYRWDLILKEWVGYLAYKVKGYL